MRDRRGGRSPEELERGSPRRVATLLASSREALLRVWEQRVRSDPAVEESERLGTLALRDDLPVLLDQLVAALDEKESHDVGAETIGRQVWHSPESHVHARERFASGYTIGEVLRELSHLRMSLLEVLRAHGVVPDEDAIRILETAIDEAMTVAATELDRVAHTALAASEERLSAILHTAMDAIITTDETLRIVVFNASAERIFRCPARDALGSSLERFLPERFRETHGEHMRRFAVTGSTSRAMGRLGRVVALRADGEEFPIEATISHARVADAQLFTVVLRDVSEQVRLEALRDEAEARLRGILENTTAVVYVKDAAGRMVLVNRRFEQIFGVRAADALGRTDDELFPPEVAARYRENDALVRERGEAVEVTEIAPQADGLHTYLSVKFPMRIGRELFVGGISTDITIRERAQAALAREVELRELFMAVLAHDLRVPLSAVVMSASALLGRDDLAPDVARNIARIQSGGRRMAKMIEQLLEVSRVRSGQEMRVERAAADLGRIVADVVAELEDAYRDRAFEVSVSGDARGRWDASRIAQVVANLGSNAVTHGRAGEPVRFAVRGGDASVELEVSNASAAGPIPRDLRERLFDPFARAATSPSDGLGLGLYIVDQIVRSHGGEVSVESDEQSTRFSVRLPRT